MHASYAHMPVSQCHGASSWQGILGAHTSQIFVLRSSDKHTLQQITFAFQALIAATMSSSPTTIYYSGRAIITFCCRSDKTQQDSWKSFPPKLVHRIQPELLGLEETPGDQIHLVVLMRLLLGEPSCISSPRRLAAGLDTG